MIAIARSVISKNCRSPTIATSPLANIETHSFDQEIISKQPTRCLVLRRILIPVTLLARSSDRDIAVFQDWATAHDLAGRIERCAGNRRKLRGRKVESVRAT